MGQRLGPLDLEVQVRHDACPPGGCDRSFRPVKNRPISSQTSVPPERPRQWVRIRPTSLKHSSIGTR